MPDDLPGKHESPPTLASLRARPGKSRSGKRAPTPSQPGLLFAEAPAPKTKPRPTAAKVVAAELPTAPTRRILSVADLVTSIRQQLETTYTDLWVEGEISNCRPAPSGHVYLTLKDGEAQLPVVLFRRQAQLLRFRPADGQQVLVRGRISIYESRGQLQLIAETMEPRGAGALQLAYEQLKARLLAEGLFDADRKRPLPPFPVCIGVITSPTGAVIRDIVNVVRRRHARLNLLIYPALMQGPSCASTVAAGIRYFNANPGKADIVLIARGGGSIEDLAGFNDEALARTIAASQIPIVSAIGHETDFTIADFVADLRAPTPSAAAELITSAQHRIEERVEALSARVLRAGRYHLMYARQRYARLSAESVLIRLRDAINRREQRIDELRYRLEAATQRRHRALSNRLAALTARLRRQDPSIRLAAMQRRLQTARQHLLQSATRAAALQRTRLQRATARLEAMSPLAVLSRGYALIYAPDGTLLKSSADILNGQQIRARLGTGALIATVTETSTS